MRQLTIQTFIYYLIYSGARNVFPKIMQRILFKAWCPLTIFVKYLINSS